MDLVKRRYETLKDVSVWALLSGGIIVGACSMSNWANDTLSSASTMKGRVSSFASEGVLWDTHEGTLALKEPSYLGANTWSFSIDRQRRNGENIEQLVADFQRYRDSQELVQVTYREPYAVWPWRAGTSYLVQRVEPVKE